MYSKYSSILNNSDIADNKDQPISQNSSIVQQIFQELNLEPEYPDYSNVDYWNNRYSTSKEKYFEWLQSYKTLKTFIHNCLFGRFDVSSVLYAGCGNSQLQDHLYQDGIQNIKCIDFSDILIKKKHNSIIPYILMDVTNKIDFGNEEFDLIIDKSLLDSLMCGQSFFERVQKYLNECFRVLKQNGQLFLVSFGHPDTRIIYLKQFKVQIIQIEKLKIEQVNDLDYHYLYICTK